MGFYEVYVRLPADEALLVETDVLGLVDWHKWLDELGPGGAGRWGEEQVVSGEALIRKLTARSNKDSIVHLDSRKREVKLSVRAALTYLDPTASYSTTTFEI